jgi:hypothetical protein
MSCLMRMHCGGERRMPEVTTPRGKHVDWIQLAQAQACHKLWAYRNDSDGEEFHRLGCYTM